MPAIEEIPMFFTIYDQPTGFDSSALLIHNLMFTKSVIGLETTHWLGISCVNKNSKSKTGRENSLS